MFPGGGIRNIREVMLKHIYCIYENKKSSSVPTAHSVRAAVIIICDIAWCRARTRLFRARAVGDPCGIYDGAAESESEREKRIQAAGTYYYYIL